MATLNQADIKSAGGIAPRVRTQGPLHIAAQRGILRHRRVDRNLYLGFRSHALGSGWERAQVQAVRWRWFQTAAKIVRYGRQTFLKINSAMLAVFAAIRERCARFMASCRKDALCQKRRDHRCGILAFACTNLIMWAAEPRPERRLM